MKATESDRMDPRAANARFRSEAERYRFHFRCSSCAHVEHATGNCSLGYPNHYLRGEHRAITADGELTFCKFFELGET